jgi:hypothetical protein
MPAGLQELRDQILNAVALVDIDFLNKMWDELGHRLDVFRITSRSHAGNDVKC